MKDEAELLEIRYKIAIDARDKLNENYHKWMSFYYIANGSILVAITTLYSKPEISKGVFILSLIGALVCMLWNLSCKGYYYWSNSWIDIIIDIEYKLLGKENLVYGAFSDKVASNKKQFWLPLEPYNISTPKLTLLFSIVSFISWTLYSAYTLQTLIANSNIFLRIFYTILLTVVIFAFYFRIPKSVKSRKEGKHKLI